jgi:hypothetical protein
VARRTGPDVRWGRPRVVWSAGAGGTTPDDQPPHHADPPRRRHALASARGPRSSRRVSEARGSSTTTGQLGGTSSGIPEAIHCRMIAACDLLKCRVRSSSLSCVDSSDRSIKCLPYFYESWERPPGISRLGVSPTRQLAEKSTSPISRSIWCIQGAMSPPAASATCRTCSDVSVVLPRATFRRGCWTAAIRGTMPSS